jgi:transglutaminase-like putative cysteine protease
MKFSVNCSLQYDVAADTTLILNVEAQRNAGQNILAERFSISSGVPTDSHVVPETGNRYRRMVLPVGQHQISYTAEIETRPFVGDPGQIAQVPVAALPFEVFGHLSPSRYCQSDKLGRFAWRTFGDIANGHEKVTAICNWIFENVDYLEGSSDISTSAYDTFTLRAGVCRDFAHLGITFARALGIPARFVSAYALDLIPQDFHAVFEAYLGDRWYLFDATRLCPIDGIMRIGIGRDAADSAFASYFGQLSGPPKLISVKRLDDQQPSAWTVQAVSISAN